MPTNQRLLGQEIKANVAVESFVALVGSICIPVGTESRH